MHDLHPYVPGEQPPVPDLVKLNTNESPVGPSPRVLDAIRAEAAETLRLYPDPEATGLRRAPWPAITVSGLSRSSPVTARMRCLRMRL